MDSMQAVVVESAAPGHLSLKEVAMPVEAPGEVLIRVAAVSLNRGEVRRAGMAPPGTVLGWDLAGVVERAAADGSGPPEGSRVVGFVGSGAWAQHAPVAAGALALLPESVTFEQAATLPVAGLTALYALEKGGGLLGRSVLVLGASGGVGLFAIRLASLSGAVVTGVVRSEERGRLVADEGARHVLVSEDGTAVGATGRYDLVIDPVGGAALAQALTLLAPGGTCVTLGATAAATSTIETRAFFNVGGATLYGFTLFHEVLSKPASEGLARLAGLVAEGQLRPHVSLVAPWTEIGTVAERLMQREFAGKAVLRVG